jgi:hypothetical protein
VAGSPLEVPGDYGVAVAGNNRASSQKAGSGRDAQTTATNASLQPTQRQQNGRHERMHLTLKRETASPPRATLIAQQRAFDRWCKELNEERPHEALDWREPASLYAPSDRLFKKITRDWYSLDSERELVDKHGHVRWKGRRIRISAALRDQLVDFRPSLKRGRWVVSFGPAVLGTIDERSRKRTLNQPPRSARAKRVSG